MVSIQQMLGPALAQFPAWALVLALLAVSLVLIFAGKSLVKVVAFLVVGFLGAAFGGSLAVHYLSPDLGFVGVLLGFVAGGLLGLVLLPLGVGLAAGYAGYLVALDLALGPMVALIAGATFFIVGALLSGKILGIATAVVGGLLLFDVLSRFVGLDPFVATLLAAALTVVGLWVQLAPERHPTQPTSTAVGGQPGETH